MNPCASFACLFLVGACGVRAEPMSGPGSVLSAYSSALRERRPADAYRLLSADARRAVSLQAFERMVLESPDDMAEIARALGRPVSAPLVTAEFQSPAGEPLRLVLEGGTWRIDANALDRYGHATPRQALLGFLRAYEHRRFDILLRYAPAAEREGPAAGWSGGPSPLSADQLRAAWTGPQQEPIDSMIRAIRAALPECTIEETSDRAIMTYGPGQSVSFIREGAAWKIADLK